MVLQKKLSGEVPPPTDFYPDIAPEVVTALMATLTTEREARTASAAALGEALEGASKQALKRQAREGEGARRRAEQQTEEARLQSRAPALAVGASRPSPVPGLEREEEGLSRGELLAWALGTLTLALFVLVFRGCS